LRGLSQPTLAQTLTPRQARSAPHIFASLLFCSPKRLICNTESLLSRPHSCQCRLIVRTMKPHVQQRRLPPPMSATGVHWRWTALQSLPAKVPWRPRLRPAPRPRPFQVLGPLGLCCRYTPDNAFFIMRTQLGISFTVRRDSSAGVSHKSAGDPDNAPYHWWKAGDSTEEKHSCRYS
jgi:hypothetical protein